MMPRAKPMYRRLRWLAAGSLLVVLGGCAALGAGVARPASEEGVRQVVQVGSSTKEEVKASMGAAIVTTFPSGYEVWVYPYQASMPAIVGYAPVVGEVVAAVEAVRRERELAILFDPQGIARKVRLRESASQVERLLAPH